MVSFKVRFENFIEGDNKETKFKVGEVRRKYYDCFSRRILYVG